MRKIFYKNLTLFFLSTYNLSLVFKTEKPPQIKTRDKIILALAYKICTCSTDIPTYSEVSIFKQWLSPGP